MCGIPWQYVLPTIRGFGFLQVVLRDDIIGTGSILIGPVEGSENTKLEVEKRSSEANVLGFDVAFKRTSADGFGTSITPRKK